MVRREVSVGLSYGRVVAMKVSYFEDTDTLYIELQGGDIGESKDLGENTFLDLRCKGQYLRNNL